MPHVTIVVDDVNLKLAEDIQNKMKTMQYSHRDLELYMILSNAANLGLEQMREIWLVKGGPKQLIPGGNGGSDGS